MPRSVVLAGTTRCDRCLLPPRWCICSALEMVTTGIEVDVLLHGREQWRPSSTGKLIARCVTGACCRIYERHDRQRRPPAPDLERNVHHVSERFSPPNNPFAADDVWILHPRGEPLPASDEGTEEAIHAVPPRRVVLLDGSWGEAEEMLRAAEQVGRRVRLSLSGQSRFWLREQRDRNHFSTAEALLAVFQAAGDRAAESQFRLHFELHVYATLRARGHKQLAADYLESSPLPKVIPAFLAALDTRRPG
jgi:DTW domain-containing protein YfiP